MMCAPLVLGHRRPEGTRLSGTRRRPGLCRAASRPVSLEYCKCSPDLLRHLDGKGQVPLGIDLGDVRPGVTEGDLCGFEAKLTAYLCRVQVTQLVRVPAG